MPIYEYRCEQGHQFEVLQRMSDDPVTVCETCEAPVQRVFHPIAVHFKGSGFYNTDYGTKKRQREKDASESSGESKSTESKESKDSTSSSSSESKSDSGSSSKTSEGGSAKKADKPAKAA